MVRRRVELRLVQDRTSRLARFSKRRAGLLKKAREIAVLCDAEVGVIIFSPLGKLSHFSSQASMDKTIQRYQQFLEAGSSFRKHVCRQSQSKGFTCQKVNMELLEVAQRLSDGGSTVKSTENELDRLREQLSEALQQVRTRMEKALLQERRDLQLALGKDADEVEGGCNETAEQQACSSMNRKRSNEGCNGDNDALALRLW